MSAEELAAHRLMETIADIAYLAGSMKHFTGDSRKDVADFILWAKEFEALRKVSSLGCESYNGENYMTAIEKFALNKLNP